MGLNPNFTKFSTASPVIATYDYTDIAELTGVQVFHLFRQTTSAATTYGLTKNVMFSDDSELAYPVVQVRDGTVTTDDDFDLTEFNLPADIKGIGKIVIPYGCVSFGGGGGFTFSITCTLRHVTADAVPVETDIVSVVSPTITIGVGVNKVAVFNLPVVIPLTHFKAGETLRLTVAITMTGGNTFDYCGYGTDPKAREAKIGGVTGVVLDSSDSQFLCPFRLNV